MVKGSKKRDWPRNETQLGGWRKLTQLGTTLNVPTTLLLRLLGTLRSRINPSFPGGETGMQKSSTGRQFGHSNSGFSFLKLYFKSHVLIGCFDFSQGRYKRLTTLHCSIFFINL